VILHRAEHVLPARNWSPKRKRVPRSTWNRSVQGPSHQGRIRNHPVTSTDAWVRAAWPYYRHIRPDLDLPRGHNSYGAVLQTCSRPWNSGGYNESRTSSTESGPGRRVGGCRTTRTACRRRRTPTRASAGGATRRRVGNCITGARRAWALGRDGCSTTATENDFGRASGSNLPHRRLAPAGVLQTRGQTSYGGKKPDEPGRPVYQQHDGQHNASAVPGRRARSTVNREPPAARSAHTLAVRSQT